MITVCLTHDVDRVRKTYQYFTHTVKYLLHGQVKRAFRSLAKLFARQSPYWGFDEVLRIENQYGVKSTFFFLDESAKIRPWSPKSFKLAAGRYKVTEKKVAETMRYLDQNGWEVGVHGSYYSYNNLELLKREKSHIENVIGHPVIGIRQHYLNWNENTWLYQAQAGFLYDSTWGFTRDIGFKDGHVKPFTPIQGQNFLEIPMTIMDSCFEADKNRWEKLEQIIVEIDKQDACLVINFHTNNFDEIDFPNYKSNFIRLIETLQQKGAKFVTMREILKL